MDCSRMCGRLCDLEFQRSDNIPYGTVQLMDTLKWEDSLVNLFNIFECQEFNVSDVDKCRIFGFL